MEKIRQQSYSESLKTTLNCYQLSSADSLGGPSGYSALAAQLWFKDNKEAPPNPPPPLIQIPLLMPNDTSTQRAETTLAGKKIACFIVGGEKRLCLPQILTTVLREFSISEINRICAELHIYCSRCSPDQLEILKVLRILPFNTTQCGLITKTDAERLVSTLSADYQLSSKRQIKQNETTGFQVYHECFGRGDGMFYPDIYIAPESLCIVCLDCKVPLSPVKFVSHSHRGLEKHTCHWGFDPENWRNYLLLSKDETSSIKECEESLSTAKAKFNFTHKQLYSPTSPSSKRRHEPDNEDSQTKKFKEENLEDIQYSSTSPRLPSLCYGMPFGIRPSAFKPWLPGLAAASLSQIPTELRAANDDALVNALIPMMHDRRLLPGYLQFGSPAVLSPSEPIPNWNTTLPSVKITPNLTLASAELQKQTSSFVIEREHIRECHSKSIENIPRSVRRKSSVNQHTEYANKKLSDFSLRGGGESTGVLEHHLENISNSSCQLVESSSRLPHQPLQGKCEVRLKDEVSIDPNRQSLDVIDPVLHSPTKVGLNIDKTTASLLAISKDVAAASAMLELSSTPKSSKQCPLRDRKGFDSCPTKSAKDNSDHCLFLVVPLSPTLEHFKWTFGPSSYIISAAGTQELQVFHSLLNDACRDTALKNPILHNLVKMKSRYEEKLDIQARVKKDLETELEHIKASKRQRLQEAANVRKDIKQEMENMRHDHNKKMQEMQHQLNQLQIKLDSSDSNDQKRGVSFTLEMEKLKTQIQDKEESISQLRIELVQEQDKRLLSEMRLEEIMDGSRGRIPLLMDGSAFSIMRRKDVNDRTGNVSFSQPLSVSGRKSLETIVSSSCSVQTSFCNSNLKLANNDSVVDITRDVAVKARELSRHTSSKDSGIQDIAVV